MVSLTSISLNNSIGIVTIEDETVHKYFTNIWWEQDNDTPVGYAQVKAPYDPQILKYWSTYHGTVVIHAQLTKDENDNKVVTTPLPKTSLSCKTIDKVKTKKKDNKIEIINKEYNYSFIGHVHKVKQIGHSIIISFNDLGWKFMQKVPKEFRESYIAGQSLDNAFQAICEFLGVDFAYSIEDLSQYNFGADGYSIEKGGEVIEEVPSLFEEYKNPEEEEETNLDEDMANGISQGTNESGNLPQQSQAIKRQQSSQNQNNSDNALNSNVTNNGNEQQQQEEDTASLDEKLEKYQEEFEDKIKYLFIGNTIYESNITDAIMNYDAITITPQAVTSSTMTSATDANALNTNTTDNQNNTSTNTSDNNQQQTTN